MTHDIGLTHVALCCTDLDASKAFYARFANMQALHERVSDGGRVAWLSDKTRPFVVVLVESADPRPILHPFAHLGVGCRSREEVDRLAGDAKAEGILREGPTDSGPPVGYWAFISDPDGHTLELAFGQEVGITVEGA